jgi:hypothetical protein
MRVKRISKRSEHKKLKGECDRLWAVLIKLRAGNKSEISGKTESLHAHHLRGKNNYRLRYELLNGVCCTSGEHFFGFHVAGRREKYEQIIARQRRADLYAYLEQLQWEVCKTRLSDVYIFLQNEIKAYE